MARVTAGARLHFGFCNLSLAHERLYGGLGLAVDEPRLTVVAEAAESVACSDPVACEYAAAAVELLDLPGAEVRVERPLPRHAGLGSGTQLALATLTAVARAHGRETDPRERAPDLGRGGRSGVGVATFEDGGFVVDAGHATARFTTAPPSPGEWAVPVVAVRRRVPPDWRFLVIVPDAAPGRSDAEEDESIRAVVERADPDVSDRIAGVLVRRALPALAEGDARRFGTAIEEIGRLNGAWYADEQGGVYRPPVGDVVAHLSEASPVYGVGQSSWGPTVYGVTDTERADEAASAGREALAATGVDGEVVVVRARNRGADLDSGAEGDSDPRHAPDSAGD